MRQFTAQLMIIFLVTLAQPALAELRIFTCEPEWASLIQELGADKENIFSATTALQDPHHIEARPSLIAKLRRADLLVCTGAGLEAAWLPLLLRQAANPKVLPGRPGYFEASAQVQRLDIPQNVDRSMGDVHASGNPHIHLDPRRVAIIAQRLSERLAQIDPANSGRYQTRWREFDLRWRQSLRDWEQRAMPLKGMRMVVHHKAWTYFFDWLGIHEAATLEPKPGLPPSPGHLTTLQQQLHVAPARLIILTAYSPTRSARWLSKRTAIPVVVLPYTVGGTKEARDLYTLFDDSLNRMLEALQ